MSGDRREGERRRQLGAVLFWALAAVVVAAHAVVLWQSIVVTRLWEDEAFNLTVPLNLLRGLGYASDGALSGSALTPFDPRISTGPVVLLPIAGVLALGADLVVGARLVPAAFYVALLVAVGILGRRIGGRWALLVAITVPLTLETAASVSPIQGPADILGEIPAAALCAWAMVVLARRPALAGLLIGLALQTKYISLLFVPAFAIGLWLQTPGMPWRSRVRRALAPAGLVAAPTLVVEIVTFASVGTRGYVDHLRGTIGFVRNGGQRTAPTSVLDKLQTLAGSWFVPGGVLALVAVAAVAVCIAAFLVVRRDPARLETAVRAPRRDLLVLLVVAAVGLVVFVGWWATAAHTPLWIRHPSPGLFAFVPVLAAFVVLALRVLGRAAAVIGGVLIAALLAVQTAGHVSRAFAEPFEDLAAQRVAAAELAARGDDRYAAAWGGPVSIVVLSGAHVGLWDAGDQVAGWPRLLQADADADCVPPRTVVGGYAVCGPASVPAP